nr:HEPN domain-containing protein [Meiothermus rufus]
MNRALDWLMLAGYDLELAHLAAGAGRHQWACFAAQQAAEKAVKAVLSLGQEAWGHLVARLLAELPMEVPPCWWKKPAAWMPFTSPRYPEGPPAEHYGPLQSQEALR